jgi:hypothetical protein
MDEWIELSVCIGDSIYSVREQLPTLVKVSSGPMSLCGAMSGAVDRITGQLARKIDQAMHEERSFIAWNPKQQQLEEENTQA